MKKESFKKKKKSIVEKLAWKCEFTEVGKYINFMAESTFLKSLRTLKKKKFPGFYHIEANEKNRAVCWLYIAEKTEMGK